MVSSESPIAMRIIRFFMTVLSLTLTTICVYIVMKSPSVTRIYAGLLVLLLLGAVAVDVLMQWVFDPVFDSYLVCMYRRAPWLNFPLSAAFCAGALLSIVALGGSLYLALFLYRHQAIAPAGSRLKFSVRAQISFLAIYATFSASLGAAFYIGREPLIGNLRCEPYLVDVWDSSVFERVDCFYIFDMRLFMVACVTVPPSVGILIVAVARHTFIMLREMKNISVKTQKLHRILTRSLVIQALVPVVIIVLPFICILAVAVPFALIGWEQFNNFAIQPIDLIILLVSFHATVHAVALVLTTPTFRMKFHQIFTRRRPRTSVSPRNISVAAFTM